MLRARPEQPHALGTPTRLPAGTVDGRRISMVLGIWIAISAVSGTANFLGMQTFASSWKATDGATVVVVAHVYVVLLATMFVAFGSRSGLRDRLSFRFTTFGDVALGLGVWVLVLAVNALLYAALSPIVFGSFQTTAVHILRLVSDMSRLPGADPVSLFFIVIRACVVVPLTEELVFRGMLFGWLRQRAPAAATILISAAIFAVYHFYPLVMPLAADRAGRVARRSVLDRLRNDRCPLKRLSSRASGNPSGRRLGQHGFQVFITLLPIVLRKP